MFGSANSDDQRPLTYFRGYPIYATTFIIGAFVLSVFATTLCLAFGYGQLFAYYLEFDSRLVLAGGQIWRFLTYGFWNVPSLAFVIDMLMFVWFGLELERFFGRKIFLRFYIILYLLQPLTYTALGLLRPTVLVGETGAFAMFIAFATLYPNASMLFNILAKWMAIVLVALYTLMALAARDVVALIALWVTAGFAHGFVRYEQGRLTLPKFQFAPRKPKLRVLPSAQVASSGAAKTEPVVELDTLLDKIAKTGMASLSAQERAQLEKAREALLRKDQRGA